MRTLIIMALLLLVGCAGGHAAPGLQGGGAMPGMSKIKPVNRPAKKRSMRTKNPKWEALPRVRKVPFKPWDPCPPPITRKQP